MTARRPGNFTSGFGFALGCAVGVMLLGCAGLIFIGAANEAARQDEVRRRAAQEAAQRAQWEAERKAYGEAADRAAAKRKAEAEGR